MMQAVLDWGKAAEATMFTFGGTVKAPELGTHREWRLIDSDAIRKQIDGSNGDA